MPADPNLLIPLKLDAFVFNEKVCDGKPTEAKVAPITQPNYTFLRLDKSVVQNDILPHVDLHHAAPASVNSRFTDLGTQEPRKTRIGVYLSWMMPRVYRSGIASTSSVPDPNVKRSKAGFRETPGGPVDDHSVPEFRDTPTRWLVLRIIDPTTMVPAGVVPEVQGWVIESDRRRSINDLGPEIDLQVDVSPFIKPGTDVNIPEQAEVFIGLKEDADKWTEKGDNTQGVDRVKLSLLNSGNNLFADYQPHNSNVFSMLDNFGYTGADGNPAYLTAATASYYVIGWHSDATKDPLYMTPPPPPPPPAPTRGDRLSSLQMQFTDPKNASVPPWTLETTSSRIICHGAIYTVLWDAANKPKHVPADIHSDLLNSTLPISIGTTPLDALLAYIRAHVSKADPEIANLERDLIALQTLLIAQEAGVDAHHEACDVLLNSNYSRQSGGKHFHLSGGDAGIEPLDNVKDALATLNQTQFAADLLGRALKRKRWDMFSWWWRYISDIAPDTAMYNSKATELTTTIGQYETQLHALQKLIANPDPVLKDAQPGVLGSGFFQGKDPTLLVGGIESGWPTDYLDKLFVRLDTQVVSGTPVMMPKGWTDYVSAVIGNMPGQLKTAAIALSNEFLLLKADGGAKPTPPPTGTVLPLYHDQGAYVDNPIWRDRWNDMQPWFPLFMEWEAEYTHVPYELWSLEERPSTVPGNPATVRYGIKDKTVLSSQPAITEDRRSVSGRVLILPQPNFSLATKVKQLFTNTPTTILDPIISPDERIVLLAQLHKLAFLSAPLSGLTDHLLTLIQGTHMKPNLRQPGGFAPTPIAGAITAGTGGGFKGLQLDYIAGESDLTPYGKFVQALLPGYASFKPATHGQLRFTKLNIIDKFGQAIHALDPRPSKTAPPPLYPCLSDYYAPQMLDGNIANTIVQDAAGFCEFVQLPPAINQPARLNAAFITADKDGTWHPATEWENPIWGWIVINFADHGLQLFTQDGTFYREARLGGPTGESTTPAWLPFAPPDTPVDTKQLDALVARFHNDPTYLKGFVAMINSSLNHAPAAPNAYAEFLSSLVGKPLALVNMGWSLELASDEYINQSTFNNTTLPLKLLGKGGYQFPVKLGDKDRVYDGLVGYCKMGEDGQELDLDTIYTYFLPGEKPGKPPPPPPPPLKLIDTSDFPLFEPFYVSPAGTVDAITSEWNSAMTLFGAIVDPFTAVHGYSSLLPVTELKLPNWTWQKAMEHMTAFFRMGPVLVTKDVSDYQKEYRLVKNYDPSNVIPGSAVGIPAGGVTEWSWLQPYIDTTVKEEDGRVYAPLGLGKLDNRPRFEKGPYTAIEGYLQLRKPIAADAVPVPGGG